MNVEFPYFMEKTAPNNGHSRAYVIHMFYAGFAC